LPSHRDAVPDDGQHKGGMAMLKGALLVSAGIVIGFGANAVLAQNNAPYYEVAEINVKDQAGYEASGVDKVRESQIANGGKTIAGGYNKAHGVLGDPPANRYLIIQYPSKEAADKHWNESVSKWWDSEGHKYAAFRAIGVEAVAAK
jgi:uncharacterized protein (DUF1330 family)